MGSRSPTSRVPRPAAVPRPESLGRRMPVVPGIVVAAGVLAIVAGTSACGVVRGIFVSASPEPRPFNHAAHLDRGLDCASCHATAEKEASAGMPSKDDCMTCHEEIDKEPGRPKVKTVAWFLDELGRPAWSRFTKQDAEVKFTHAAHAAKQVQCAACHAGIAKDTGLVPSGPQRMASCTSCHELTRAKNDCATCHTELDRMVAPRNHALAWKGTHGACARAGREASTANDCAMCHGKNECATCHQTEMPANHTGFWRMKGHGAAAGVDRQRCSTCHSSDSCNRCHEETAPMSHGAGWAASGHCTGCHVPLQSSPSCFTCHRETPGHAAAPAKPAWHNASMNCRACHSLSMKHPDNGDNCNACHQ